MSNGQQGFSVVSRSSASVSELISRIADNIQNVIVGKRAAIEHVIVALISGGHVLIEDVPGVGKTSLVSALSKSISCTFRRIQFTPDVLPTDVTGFSMYNMKENTFEFKGTDKTTQGDWFGIYGNAGYLLFGIAEQWPVKIIFRRHKGGYWTACDNCSDNRCYNTKF